MVSEDGWILASIFVFKFMHLDFVSVHKQAKKNLNLNSHLVNNPYVLLTLRALIAKTMAIILFMNMTWNHLGFGRTELQGIFTTKTKQLEDMFLYQSNPVGVELFSHVLQTLSLGLCYIMCTQKSMSAT